MARVQHNCTGCVPIDASIIEVYTQLISTESRAEEAAERAEHAAEHAIGKSPYIGENGDWWEWNDEQAAFIDTGVQAQGQVAVDIEMSTTSTNPVQNRVVTAAVNEKYTKPATGIPATDIAEGVIPDVSQFITASVNNLVNYYLKSETYNKTEVDSLIAAVSQFSYEVVATLPTASASTMYKIYLVPSAHPETQNVKDEYITIRSGSEGSYTYAWEQIGSTAIDLSGYVTTQQLNTALSAYTTTANLTTLLAAKQDVIADLATIRSGAASGATAYQKPSGGIPKSDLSSGVQGSLDLADSAIQARPQGEITPVITPADYATREELGELEAKVTDLEGEVGESEREAITYTDDYFVNTNGTSANVETPTSSSSWRYALVPCSPGEKFTVSGRTTSATVAAIWCFLDSSYNILSRVASDATEISNVSLTAPANTAYLLLNDNKSGAVSYEGMTLREIVNAQGNEIDNIPTVIDGVVDSKIGRYEDIVTVWSDGAINSSGGVDSTDYFEHSDFIPKSKYGAIRSYTKLTTARLVVVFFQEDKSTVVGYKSIADYGVESNEWATFNIAWIEGAAYCKVNRSAGAGSTLKGYTSVIQDVAALDDSINVVRFDTRLTEFRLELLPVGSYIGNDGQIYTSTTPPYRGTARLEIEPNTELYVPGASYYLLYKEGGTLTNLVAMPTDKKVIVPVGAKSIVFDCPPLSVDFLDIVVKRNTVNPSKLWLLPIGQYYGSDGTIYETGAWRGSSKVSVSEGDKIRVPLAAYYLTWNGATLVRGLTAPPANKIITIPSGVDSIAFDISPNDDLKEIEIEYLPNIDENHAQWKGKQWYAFGCSISDTGPLDNGHTETGTYPAFLVGMSGLVHHNWAWGGSCIADRARTNSDGQHPTAVQRIDAAIEEGSIANADLITIDGAYNDYGANVPLGEITDKEDGSNNDSTFFMALYQAVMKLKAVAPNARIVFLTDNTGQTTQQQGDISEYYHKNSVQGLFQRDYQKAMIEFANFVGVSVIDCGGKSGISSIHPQYLADHIHQSQLGGLQFAQTIWEELKEMQPMKR